MTDIKGYNALLGHTPHPHVAEILAISCDSKTFSIFHIHDTTEIHAVFWHNYKKSTGESLNDDTTAH